MTLLTNTCPRVNKAVSNMAEICNARILLKSWYIIFPFCSEFLYPFGVWSIATVFHVILEVWSRGGVLAAHKYMKDICSIHSSKRHDNIRSSILVINREFSKYAYSKLILHVLTIHPCFIFSDYYVSCNRRFWIVRLVMLTLFLIITDVLLICQHICISVSMQACMHMFVCKIQMYC